MPFLSQNKRLLIIYFVFWHLPGEILIAETLNLCSGNGSQLFGSECTFKSKYCFLVKTDKGNGKKITISFDLPR